MTKTFKKSFIKCVLLFLGIALTTTSCVEPIDAGHVGIKFNKAGDNRGVSSIAQVSGWVWYNPITTRIEEFPIFTQTVAYQEFEVNSKDGTPFKVDPTLNYYAQADKVPAIYTQFRKTLPEIQSGYMATSVYEAYRSVINSYDANALIGSRTRVENQVKDSLRASLQAYGFVVQQLTTRIIPPKSLTDAINAKNEAVQMGLQINNKVASARAQAKIDSTQAVGRAQALRIDADAKAYSNAKMQQSLTKELLEQQRIAKWDGKYPQYMLSGNSQSFFPIK